MGADSRSLSRRQALAGMSVAGATMTVPIADSSIMKAEAQPPTQIGGNAIVVAQRTALGALTGVTAGRAALLTEPGREGVFLFQNSVPPAAIAADTRQMIYIAPSSDRSGASGAWVRQFDGPINVLWAGIVEGDSGGANGSANAEAFAALKAVLHARGYNKTGNHQGLDPVRFPPGWYEFADHDGDGVAISLFEGTYNILGASTAKIDETTSPTGATVLKIAAGVTGIVTQKHDTSGKTAVDGTDHPTAKGTQIVGINFQGSFNGTEGDHHGILARTTTFLSFCQFNGFEGEGAAFIGDSTGPLGGNVDGSRILGCHFDSNRIGLKMDGTDANTCKIDLCSFRHNRQAGRWESGSLGNEESMSHYSANGATAWNDGVNIGVTTVSDGTHRYSCAAGQDTDSLGLAAGASANAPTTGASNAFWLYSGLGGTRTGIPNWSSGIRTRHGGAWVSDSRLGKNLFNNPYAEGNQGWPHLTGGDLIINGSLNGHIGGARIHAAADGSVNVAVNGTVEATFGATGMNLPTGNGYRVNATKVVGEQQRAIADHDSDATVNAILSVLRTHGLIAT